MIFCDLKNQVFIDNRRSESIRDLPNSSIQYIPEVKKLAKVSIQ